MRYIFYILSLLAILLPSCGAKNVTDNTAEHGYGNIGLPKARVYKTNGKFDDYVPVTMDAGKVRLVGYPAPSDVNPQTSPIPLADGFLLDRQGVGINTVFLDWPRATYASLPQTPSKGEISEHLLPLSYVMTIVELPMTTAEAMADTASVNILIRKGFPGCKILTGSKLKIGEPDNIIGTPL